MGMFDSFGSFASGVVDFASAEYFRDKASDEATANREWQKDMRSTQYQTAVADMKAAGLNPMLAYSQGGAGNLGGGIAAMGSASPGASYQAAETARTVRDVNSAQAAKLVAETKNTEADTLIKLVMPELIRAQTNAATVSAQQAEVQMEKLRYQIKEILPVEKWERINAAGLSFAQTVESGGRHALNKTELEKVLPLIVQYKALQNRLAEYEIPEARAMGKSWESGWGEMIRPYLGDVGRVVGSAGAAAGLFYGMRGAAGSIARRGAGEGISFGGRSVPYRRFANE